MNDTVEMFSIDIDNVTMSEALERVEELVEKPGMDLVVTPNAQHICLVQEDEDFLSIYNEASLVIPDGYSLILASQILNSPLKQRVTGADLAANLKGFPNHEIYKGFLLGGVPGAAKATAQWFNEVEDRGLVIRDYLCPPHGFNKQSNYQDSIIDMINDLDVDILLVGLGCPKQEKWVARNIDQLDVSVAIGVGATFDFLSGEKERAPLWMQENGLEWLFRLTREPKRLCRRYTYGNLKFLHHFFRCHYF